MSDFGFELLNRLHGQQIDKKEDVLILLLHWYLLKNGFKCIGLGDSRNFCPTEEGSETLPEDWNKQAIYKLRYLKESHLYIVIGTKSDNDFLINFMKVDDTKSSSVILQTETIVKELQGPLKTLIPNYSQTIDKIKHDLLEPVYSGDLKCQATQTSSAGANTIEIEANDPLRVPSNRPTYQAIDPRPMLNPRIGRDDLDPLGRMGGGGMLFDPFGVRPNPDGGSFAGIPGRLPHGAVPPGARFDPFGPPQGPLPRPPGRDPDNDHLPPPGYDDMFM